MAERTYARIINEETHEVQIGVGCDAAYYIEIGMEIMNVEQAYNGRWYVLGYAPTPPEPTVDEKKDAVRMVRDQYINDIEWRVSRYRDQMDMGIQTTDTPAMYMKILRYMQYLRDYPESSETWYEQNPLTFDEWVG